MSVWYEKSVKFSKAKVIAKLCDEKGVYKRTIVIPSDKYPLIPNPKAMQYFHKGNCEEVTDRDILDIYDGIQFERGRCYTNSCRLMNALRQKGYDAKQYVGWLFVSEDIPIHHSWVILGNHLFDFADDFTVLSSNPAVLEIQCKEDYARFVAAFYRECGKYKNSQITAPVGKPYSQLLYVGCECRYEDGIDVPQTLLKKYPNHEAYENCTIGQKTPMQKKIDQYLNNE